MKTFEAHQLINSDSDFSKILRHLPPIDADGPWVAGGSIWKAIENRPIEHDIDFFFKSAAQCERWYRELLSMPYVHRIVSFPKANDYNTTLKYHVHTRGLNKTVKLQLITFRFYNDIEKLFNSFDFTACQFALDGQTLYVGDTALDDVRNRHIIFNNVKDEKASAIHLERYVNLGFSAPENQRERFNAIMSLLKPKPKQAEPPRPSGIFGYTSPQPVRDSEDDDSAAYPRNNNDGEGINLVRVTQVQRRQPRREQRTEGGFWDSLGSSGYSYASTTAYVNTTVNTSYYTTVDLGAESPAAPNPPLAAEVPVTYDNSAGISVNPLAT